MSTRWSPGRNPEAIERSVQIPVNYDDLSATIRTTQDFVNVGVTHLILNLRPPFPAGIITRLAEEVIPKVTQKQTIGWWRRLQPAVSRAG